MEESPKFYTRDNQLLSEGSQKFPNYFNSPLTLRNTDEMNKIQSYDDPPTVGKLDDNCERKLVAHSKGFIFTNNTDEIEGAANQEQEFTPMIMPFNNGKNLSFASLSKDPTQKAASYERFNSHTNTEKLFNLPQGQQISQNFDQNQQQLNQLQHRAEEYSPFNTQRSTDKNPMPSNSISRQTSQDDLNQLQGYSQNFGFSKLKRATTINIGDQSLRIMKNGSENKRKLKIKQLNQQIQQERFDSNEKLQAFYSEICNLEANRDALLAQMREKDQQLENSASLIKSLQSQLQNVQQEKYVQYLQFENHHSQCQTPSSRKVSEMSNQQQSKFENSVLDTKLSLALLKQQLSHMKFEFQTQMKQIQDISKLEMNLIVNKFGNQSQGKHSRTESNLKLDFAMSNSGKRPSNRYANDENADSLLLHENQKYNAFVEESDRAFGNLTVIPNELGDYITSSKESDVTNRKYQRVNRNQRAVSEDPSRGLFRAKVNKQMLQQQDHNNTAKEGQSDYKRERKILKLSKDVKQLEAESAEKFKMKRQNSLAPSSLNTTRNLITYIDCNTEAAPKSLRRGDPMMSKIEAELDQQLRLTDQSMDNCQITQRFSMLSTQLSQEQSQNKLLQKQIQELQKQNAEFKTRYEFIKNSYEQQTKQIQLNEDVVNFLKKKLELCYLQQELKAGSIENDVERVERLNRILSQIEKSQQYPEIMRVIRFSLNNKELSIVEMQQEIASLKEQLSAYSQKGEQQQNMYTLQQVRQLIKRNTEEEQKFIQDEVLNKKSLVIELQKQIYNEKQKVFLMTLALMAAMIVLSLVVTFQCWQ